TAVSFGGTAATSITHNSDLTMTVVAPAHAAGIVDIVVTSPEGSSAVATADKFTFAQAAPTVTGLSPTSGTVAGGTTVTITGTNFTGATSVLFGSTAVSWFALTSDTSITVYAPAHAAGAVDVTVKTAAGTSTTSAADQFTYQAVAPTINYMSPDN